MKYLLLIGEIIFVYILCAAGNGGTHTPYEDRNGRYHEDIKMCVFQGRQVADDLDNREKFLKTQITSKKETPDYFHQAMHRADHHTMERSKQSYSLLMATKLLQNQFADKYGITPNTFSEFLQVHGFPIHDVSPEYCYPSQRYDCNPHERFRNLDGSCNNLHFPSWGKAGIAFERLLPGHYEDSVYAPRMSVAGGALPNARLISRIMFNDQPFIDPEWTQLFVSFGQLLGHDFASIVITQTSAGGIQCCTDDGSNVLPPELRHHACFPIRIPEADDFYSYLNQNCMNFVRSMTIPREDCSLGLAEQLNAVSSYLDASVIYGNNKNTADSLRSFFSGNLRVDIKHGRSFLPDSGNSSLCDKRLPSDSCYLAGDARVNQNPQLTLLQTLFMREHNIIANELSMLNPHWDDERLYQETRHIIIAIMQKITYFDWLPILINVQYLVDHKIVNSNPGYSYDYAPHVNGATLNEFTTAAYRYLHSMVHGFPSVMSPDFNEYANIRLRDFFNRPSAALESEGYFDGLMRGLAIKPMMAADEFFTKEMTNFLFASNKLFGLDLESLDIQRGRDHGLGLYINYRHLCGLPAVTSFDDLVGHIPDERLELLKGLYQDVRDIDLFVGATSEFHIEGSLVGPTIQCIIGEQFYRWRVGDRFFFDSDSNPNRLTQKQLEEVKKITIARVFCDTGDNIRYMQPDGFRRLDAGNPLIPCDDIPRIDLRAWKEFY